MVETHTIEMNDRDLRRDIRGGIEGLPLQLMIVILVATMGTAIIVGWMGNIDAPHSIGDVEVSDSYVEAENGIISGFTVEVRDQDGEYLENAVVVFPNNYVTMTTEEGSEPATAMTGPNGKAVFGDLAVDSNGTELLTLDILVYKSGYGEKTVDVLVRIT